MPGVNINGIKGFLPLPHDKTLKERQKESHYKYIQTDRGKLIFREVQKKYEQTQKGKQRALKYQNKPYHCNVCNQDIKTGYKSRHVKTQKHISNLKYKILVQFFRLILGHDNFLIYGAYLSIKRVF